MLTEQYEKIQAALNKLEEFKAEMQAFNAALKPIPEADRHSKYRRRRPISPRRHECKSQ
jgi:hypothetical protein